MLGTQSKDLTKSPGLCEETRSFGLSKKICFALAALAIGLVFAEAFLRTVSLVFPQIDELVTPPQVIKDATLEYRFASSPWERVAEGVSNTTARGPVRLVTLGDSITYGSGVTREEAWPQTLQALSEEQSLPRLAHRELQFPIGTVMRQYVAQEVSYGFGGRGSRNSIAAFNMSCPGYGPVHYVWMLEEALKLRPDMIVATFYLGNDLFDAFHLVDLYHFSGQLKAPPYDRPLERILKELRRTSPDARQGTADLSHAVVPDNRDAMRLLGCFVRCTPCQNTNSDLHVNPALVAGFSKALPAWQLNSRPTPGSSTMGSVHDLHLHARVACGKSSGRRCENRFALFLGSIQVDETESRRGWCSILCSRCSHEACGFQRRCAKALRCSRASRSSCLSGGHRKRKQDSGGDLAFFSTNGVSHMDALPPLKAALARGLQSYKISVDNHPNAYGQGVVARSILNTVQRPQFAAH